MEACACDNLAKDFLRYSLFRKDKASSSSSHALSSHDRSSFSFPVAEEPQAPIWIIHFYANSHQIHLNSHGIGLKAAMLERYNESVQTDRFQREEADEENTQRRKGGMQVTSDVAALEQPEIPVPRKVKPERFRSFKKYWDLYLIMLPGLAYFIIFKYLPMGGIVIAFQDFSAFAGIRGSEWVGLTHFRNMFMDSEFYSVFKNTLLISLYKLVWGFPGPIILALMLNEVRNMLYKRSIQTLVYLPHFLSWVIIGGILINVLSPSTGIINQLLGMIGLEPIFFLGSKEWFRTILVASDIWKEVGWGAIIYLAALSSIDPQIYEAAVVDGANKWKQLIHITLPSLMGTIVILFVLRLGSVLDVGFEQIFVLYNPLVYDVADVIETYVYRTGITQAQYSFTTAVGLFKSVISLILVVLANKAARKLGQDSLW